jgi:pimeloyl-ACP methyl ester carboxylesterase
MTDSVLSRPGAEIAYDIAGDGPFLGYSHGVLMSRAVEDALGVFPFGALAGHRRVLRYDARAHGKSTGRRQLLDYTWPSLADDLFAMADLGGPEPVDWGGASMGTGTLLWAVTRRPQRFRRLVLTIPPTTGETRAAAAGMYQTWAETIETNGKAAWTEGLRQFPAPAIFDEVEGYQMDADVSEELLPSVLRGAATTDLPPAEAIAAITQPTLILAWETDPVHPVSSAEYLAKTMPDATLSVSDTLADVRSWPRRIDEFLSA